MGFVSNFSTGKFLPCTMIVNRVNALLNVGLALNNSAVPSSLTLVGTCAASARSRIDTVPLLRMASPFLLIFLFFADAVIKPASPSISASLSVSSASPTSPSTASPPASTRARFFLATKTCYITETTVRRDHGYLNRVTACETASIFN